MSLRYHFVQLSQLHEHVILSSRQRGAWHDCKLKARGIIQPSFPDYDFRQKVYSPGRRAALCGHLGGDRVSRLANRPVSPGQIRARRSQNWRIGQRHFQHRQFRRGIIFYRQRIHPVPALCAADFGWRRTRLAARLLLAAAHADRATVCDLVAARLSAVRAGVPADAEPRADVWRRGLATLFAGAHRREPGVCERVCFRRSSISEQCPVVAGSGGAVLPACAVAGKNFLCAKNVVAARAHCRNRRAVSLSRRLDWWAILLGGIFAAGKSPVFSNRIFAGGFLSVGRIGGAGFQMGRNVFIRRRGNRFYRERRRRELFDPVAAFRGKITARFLGNRWIATIGGMCYTIYLYHWFMISGLYRGTIVLQTKILWLDLLIQFAVMAPIIIVVCTGLFVLFERPFMQRDWPAKLLEKIRRRKHSRL